MGQGGTLGVAGTPSRSRAVDVRYYITKIALLLPLGCVDLTREIRLDSSRCLSTHVRRSCHVSLSSSALRPLRLPSSSSSFPIRPLRRRFALLPRRPPLLLPLFQICKVKRFHTINGGITTCAASLTQLQSRASHRR